MIGAGLKYTRARIITLWHGAHLSLVSDAHGGDYASAAAAWMLSFDVACPPALMRIISQQLFDDL
jgi:hypothetical protein